MKKYWVLYNKELKSLYGIAVFLVIASVAVYAYDILALISEYLALTISTINYSIPMNDYGDNFVTVSVYMFPVILAYSLNIERYTKAHYLGYSIPVSKNTIMLCKFLAVITLGLLPILVRYFAEIGEEMIYKVFVLRMIEADPTVAEWAGVPTLKSMFKIYWRNNIPYFLHISLYCSIVCVAQGVMETVKNNRLLVWISAFLTCLSIFYFFFERVTGVPTYYMLWFRYADSIFYYYMLSGIIFLFSGLFLYNKYAEV